jgi:hypothetical protein
VRIWIEKVRAGETAWAVLVDGEPDWLEFMTHPDQRDAARERIITGG